MKKTVSVYVEAWLELQTEADDVGSIQNEVRNLINSLTESNSDVTIAHASDVELLPKNLLKRIETECDFGLMYGDKLLDDGMR